MGKKKTKSKHKSSSTSQPTTSFQPESKKASKKRNKKKKKHQSSTTNQQQTNEHDPSSTTSQEQGNEEDQLAPTSFQPESKKARKKRNKKKKKRQSPTTNQQQTDEHDPSSTTSQEQLRNEPHKQQQQQQSASTCQRKSDEPNQSTTTSQERSKQQQPFKGSSQKQRYPQNQFQSCQQKNNHSQKVDFYLYVEGVQVKEASIRLSCFPDPVALSPIENSSSAVQVWRYTHNYSYPNKKSNYISYSYTIVSNRYWVLSTSTVEMERRNIRAAPMQLDVFHFNTDKNYDSRTVPRSVVIYTDWLFSFVNWDRVEDFLISIEAIMKCRSLDCIAVKKCLRWILEKAIDVSVTDPQRLYLCGILDHFASNNGTRPLPVERDERTKKAFDRLLQCLNVCACSMPLPFSRPIPLGRMAHVLVENSSFPEWLTLAAHFYPYLGVKYVVHARMTAGIYDKTAYRKLVDWLLQRVNITRRQEFGDYRELLSRILQFAPDLDAVCEAYYEALDRFFFTCDADKKMFFDKFYLNRNLNSSGSSTTSSTTLVDLMRIPEELRYKMPGLVGKPLLEFAKSVAEPDQEDVDAFFQLMATTHLPKDQLLPILAKLSEPKTASRHYHLLHLLSENMFQSTWKQVRPTEKVEICWSWVTTWVVNNAKKLECGGKTTLVYQAVEELVSRTINDANKKSLVEELCKKVSEWLLQKEDPSVVLRAFKDIEKLSPGVQESYKNLVKEILKRRPSLVKRNEILSQWTHSSFGESLLLCVLDLLKIPVDPGKGKHDPELDFKTMLEWCNVWVILLSAKGCVEKHIKFKDGEKIWQELKTCITDGDISIHFLDEVKKYKKGLSLICAALRAKSNSEDHELARTKILDHISEFEKLEKDYRDKLSLLESAIMFRRNVSDDSHMVDGMPGITTEFSEIKGNLRTMKLNELNDEFWGPLFPLLDLAYSLKPLMKSASFINVAKICLQEERELKPSIVQNKAHAWIDLFKLLTSKGIERFHAQWNPVLNDPHSQTLETMESLLGKLKSKRLQEEFSVLEQYFKGRFTPDVKIYMEDYVTYPTVVKQVNNVIDVLDTLEIVNPTNDFVSTLTTFKKRFGSREEIALSTLHEPMTRVQKLISEYIEETDDVMEELGQSGELLAFLREIVNEDIRFLIDAVEEHSDQFVSESLVSELINVHSSLAPIIKKCQLGFPPELVLTQVVKLCEVHNDMAMKIKQCSTNVNSLRGLYTSVANRGELTKEIIANCLKKGVYTVSLENGSTCNAKMSYMHGDVETNSANHSLPDLQDLRSRAHLIVSSDKNAQKCSVGDFEGNVQDINFAEFIEQVNLLTEITELLLKLRSSGYVKYRSGHWPNMKGTKNLQHMKDDLQIDIEEWEESLRDARQKHYFLNYYRSHQLCVLHDFLTSRFQAESEDVLSLIHFVDPNVKKEHLEGYRGTYLFNKQTESVDSPRGIVSIIGSAMEAIFANTSSVIRPIVKDQGSSSSPLTFDATVELGELYVATLEEESPLTVNVMLTLYENTANAFPEPYQVVFCSPQTTWEEIHLVLQRCFTQIKHLKRDSLFCIANVEILANEVQFKLVDAIKEKQNSVYASESTDGNADYRLALICRGGEHHHIVEEFARYSHHIVGMSKPDLSQRLKAWWPEVKMITSTSPGLGKTEVIRREVLEKNMNVVTFSISGPLDSSKLIQRLKQLSLKKYQCLHLDIGDVNDPQWLDTFLFQLIVTGMVSSGTQLYHLRTAHVYIEIANTLNDGLLESLVIAKSFTRVHVKRSNYKDLLVSSKITSNVQVVCQYFDAYDKNRLESADVSFSGPQKVKALMASRCRQLLDKYYLPEADVTFTALKTFLGVLANQLLKFSQSAYFKIDNLESMLGDRTHGVRTNLFKALLDVSKEFASRAVTTCCSSNVQARSQKEPAQAFDTLVSSSGVSAQRMVERVEGMIQWEQSNHLLVVFHGAHSQTIAAVYRDKDRVPQNVAKLLKSQVVKGKNEELEDFKTMGQEELQKKLERIACTKSKESQETLFSSYALTPDNILKMILIILRVRAKAPVIIMGETGCGKTSLVRYLANICQKEFCTFNFHAGIAEDEVKKFIEEKESQARKSSDQIWVFLDEINTCDHLGLISEIMCHHALFGRSLSKNLIFFAACNPYKLRPKEHITTAGLEGSNVTDEYSGLVYRVHPLPEAMIDYVWDYGSLAPNDEKVYIQRMVRKLPRKYQEMLVNLLAESQKFIRDAEKNPFCVSLRDVYRCIILVQWFMEKIEEREEVKSSKSDKQLADQEHLQEYRKMSERYDELPVVRSIVLALAHCYLSRLPTAEFRQSYRERMMKLFSGTGTLMTSYGAVNSFSAIVRMEEEDYLNRMELPSGTAKNAALRENVFVMLVSILNRIPVFVVGKPGCSKSLAIQLIRSNLRGRDSKDRFFRQLPQLYVVSHQGSESSTSEGIVKVFEKARKYMSHNKDGNVLPVVLLDEVGLAENSVHNPLKVLHSLLEPGDGQFPKVAVVGISNWALDAAKMNRAIHLSRPEPTIDDLHETGLSLHNADSKDRDDFDQISGRKELLCLAKAYFQYQSQQIHDNFHGLRDYYSLIKSVSLSGVSDLQQINVALQRNFGGIPGELPHIQKIFFDKLKHCIPPSGKEILLPVTELIEENIADHRARHLMLVTSGDSAIGILKQSLSKLEKEIITIFGSRFEEDLSDDYNYRMLSRIILCMERDCLLILRDLENIYGSLYDMLNQNYAVVGKKKICRVALGPYSNPMCHVNDGFRCVVLTDYHQVDHSDPPFLNRFEKQLLRFSDALNENQRQFITVLNRWVHQMSAVQDLESQFKESDMFVGFHEDTLPSLVLFHSHDTDELNEEIIKKCKEDLMWVATPDGVLRTQKCDNLKEDSQEVKTLSDEYFQKPIHDGLAYFMETVMHDHETALQFGDEIGSKTIVMTYSTVHTDISKCLVPFLTCQTERLSAYKSEKQLTERINYFWSVSQKELLVLQCKPELDGEHMLLARSIIEDKRSHYKKACQNADEKNLKKHVCIVVHLQRRTATNAVPWQFNFLCGWKQVFLDVLEAPLVPVTQIRTKSVDKLLTSSIWPLRRFAQDYLLWCFTCIKYTRHQRAASSILRIAKNLLRSEKVYRAIENIVLQCVDTNGLEELDEFEETCFDEPWQVKVACNRQALINSSTLSSAMEQYVSRLVRQPLAKIIYFLEKENAWPPHVLDTSQDKDSEPEYEDMWCDFISKNAFFDISKIPEPLGAESYILESPGLDLHLPFSQVVFRRVDAVKELVLEKHSQINLEKNGRLAPHVQLQQIMRYSEIISSLVPEIHEFSSGCYNSYMADLFDVTSADFGAKISRQQRVSVAKCAFVSYAKQGLKIQESLHFYAQLHLFVWISKEQILDELRIVSCCQQFVRPQVLKVLTDEFLSYQDILSFTDSAQKDYGEAKDEKSNSMKVPELQRESTGVFEEAGQYDSDEENNTSKQPEQQEYSNEINNEIIFTEHKVENEDTADQSEDESTETDESEDGSSESSESSDSDATSENEFSDEESEDEAEGNSESDEKEELGEDQELFEDILVRTFCEEMLPSVETVENQNGGLESWIRNASLLLSLSLKYSNQTPAFHYLRLCVDYAKMVSVPSKEKLYPLYILNEIASGLKPDYLDADESFQMISELLITPLEENVKGEMDKYETLQKFCAHFYGRCIDTNVDTSGAHPIVERVLSMDRPRLILMMSPVILHLLVAEERESPDVFIEIITNQSVIEDCPCFQNIDKVFKDSFDKGIIHHDSYAAVMVCDLIQSLLRFEDRYSIEDLHSSDCKLFDIVHGAVKVLSGNEQDNCGLALLSSVAFVRAFLTMLSSFVVKEASVLKGDGPYSHIISGINSLLNCGGARRISLQIFFLKNLYQADMSLFELRKLCQESDMLPAIKNVFVTNKSVPKAQFHSVLKMPEYHQAKAAYWKFVKEDKDNDMLTFLKQCHDSPNHRLALLGILVNKIYLKQTARNLTDKEERLADWFSEKFRQFPLPLKELLLKIIYRRDFNHPQMRLSPESSVDEVETALLILHISFVVASGVQGENSPLYHYFRDPRKCKQAYILAHGEERAHRAFENRDSTNGPSPITCACGLRIMFKDDHADKSCPSCSTKCVNPDPGNDGTKADGNAHSLPRGDSPDTEKLSEWNSSMRDTSPSVFHALHLIMHACLFVGVTVGVSSKDNLSSLLNLEESQSSKGGRECRDPVEFCLNRIKADLTCLTTILCCKREIAIKVMHLVVEKCTDLLRSKLTQGQRLEWEVEFSNIAKEVLPEALGSARTLKEMMRKSEEENETSPLPLIDQILELDAYPTDPVQQNQQLKRLFRLTRKPSFKEFRSAFLNSSGNFQHKHSFLSLFFATFDDLPKIGYLYHLLNWARLVSSALSHRISRKEAESKSINDFICGHLFGEDRSQEQIRRELFSNFKEAWNIMCNFVNHELSPKKDEMPHLTETDYIGYCLTDSDLGIYLLTAIKLLVSLQNSILDEMIFLSTKRQNPALRFLEKDNNCSGISFVSIQEAKEKEIIAFRWSDELFKYAQNRPEYGHGEDISYDFDRMELELANDVAFGKCHLTGSLNTFIFSKELFHSSGQLFTEIRQLLPQSSHLPDNVRQGLSTLKECRINHAQNLLQHIEVVIFLLKLKLKNVDKEMTLEKFVEMWSTMLPSPFPVSKLPDPRSSIQLQHITALYEALEDLLADGAIEGLPKQFRKNLTDETKNRLSNLVDNKNGAINLQTLLIALRRLVFRYLSSEKYLPDPSTPLCCTLKEPLLWSPATPPDPQIISKDLTMEYIHSIITHLQELDQERKGISIHKQLRRAQILKQGPQRKRRVVCNFSRS